MTFWNEGQDEYQGKEYYSQYKKSPIIISYTQCANWSILYISKLNCIPTNSHEKKKKKKH